MPPPCACETGAWLTGFITVGDAPPWPTTRPPGTDPGPARPIDSATSPAAASTESSPVETGEEVANVVGSSGTNTIPTRRAETTRPSIHRLNSFGKMAPLDVAAVEAVERGVGGVVDEDDVFSVCGARNIYRSTASVPPSTVDIDVVRDVESAINPVWNIQRIL